MYISSDAGCCAVDMIEELNTAGKNGKEQFLRFCREVLDTQEDYDSNKLQLAAHYLFTEVAGHTDTKAKPRSITESIGRDRAPVGYGAEFRSFIKKNKLGDVVETKPKVNARYHKTHKIKAYLWTPNQTAVQTWWAKHRRPEDVRETRSRPDWYW